MRSFMLAAVSVAALVAVSSTSASAQQPMADNLERLGEFKTTGMTEIPTVPQTGPKADAIKKNLAKIKLPSGFKISLYALVPDARHMAVGSQGIVTILE